MDKKITCSSKGRVPKHVLPPFLKKLYQLVSECPPQIGNWDSEGTAFFVHNEHFESRVLKKYFKGGLASFIRQLHFYQFKKLDHPTNPNKSTAFGFKHKYFKRDSPHLMFVIKRKTKDEDLGYDSVYTGADLKPMKDQLDYIKEKMNRIKQDFDSMMTQEIGKETDGIIKLRSGSFSMNKIQRALMDIASATRKQCELPVC
eukprot:maker-scaffold_11-snap-gene-5.6-mRNA-1 protein AED:0.09 eAED:0.09 QI:223/1/1/1/0.66/0.5/4/175/200